MKEIEIMVKRMVKESFGCSTAFMRANLSLTNFMEMEFRNLMMGADLREIGIAEERLIKVKRYFPMEICILVSIKTRSLMEKV